MERRSAGIALLALVALAVLFLPVIGGKRIAGSAGAADVPIVGDCLVGVLAFGSQGNITLNDGQPTTRMPSGTPGDCASADAARVIAVRFGVDLPNTVKLRDIYRSTEVDCVPALTALTDRWSGSGWQWRQRGLQIGFRTHLALSTQLVAPAAEAASRHWVACVLAGAEGIPSAADINADRIAGAGGACFVSLPVGPGTFESNSVPCGRAHNVEELGSVFQSDGTATEGDYQAACRAFAVEATGMADPTSGGRLAVEAVDDGSWSEGPGSCRISVVDPNQRLSGSLLGIGTDPLPWSR